MPNNEVPNSLEHERSALSAVLIDPERAMPIVNTLVANDFYDGHCRTLFEVLQTLHENGNTLDYLNINTIANNRDYPPLFMDFVVGTLGFCPSAMRVNEYVAAIKDRSRRRQLLDGMSVLARDIYDLEVGIEAVIDRGTDILNNATPNEHGGVTAQEGARSVLNKTHYYYSNRISPYETRGINTGYRGINAATDGWKRGNVYYMLGIEHSGKTTMGMNMIMRVCKDGGRCAVFSLEQSVDASDDPQKASLWERLVLSQAGITTRQYQTGQLADAEYMRVLSAGELVDGWDLTMFDNLYTIPQIEAALRKLQREQRLDLVMIDYLKLLQQEKVYHSKNEEIGGLTSKLKQLSLRLEIPLLVPHQVSSKQIAQRKNKRIQLSDGYESGHIGQDADIVFGFNREELFKPDTDKANIIDLDVLKDRVSGGTGYSIELYFNKQVGLISDIYEPTEGSDDGQPLDT